MLNSDGTYGQGGGFTMGAFPLAVFFVFHAQKRGLRTRADGALLAWDDCSDTPVSGVSVYLRGRGRC